MSSNLELNGLTVFVKGIGGKSYTIILQQPPEVDDTCICIRSFTT